MNAPLDELQSWLRDLQAERVTHSHESLDQVMKRLELERPESTTQRQGAYLRDQLRKLRSVRAQQRVFTHLEQAMGRERLALAVSEMYPAKDAGMEEAGEAA